MSVQHAQRCLALQRAGASLNAFISAPRPEQLCARVAQLEQQTAAGPLHGKLVALKDNICTADLPTTAASAILSGYKSPFDATVVRLLRQAGAVVAGKTNMDEFGMGSHSLHSAAGPVSQPLGRPAGRYSAGGSSGGSALAVSRGMCDFALGTDTGGSVRFPAAYTGVVGFKPSYGLVSRNGVIAYANSLDTVGILARDVASASAVFSVLSQADPLDPTCFTRQTRTRLMQAAADARKHDADKEQKPVVGVPEEYVIEELDPTVRRCWDQALKHLHALGCTIRPVSLPSTRLALSAYYVIAPAEASSNLAKYDGVRYGSSFNPDATHSPASLRENVQHLADADADAEHPLYTATRGVGFGDEVRHRILLGTFLLSSSAIDNYFIQAQRVRRLVQRDFDSVFRVPNALIPDKDRLVPPDLGVDVLLTPTAPSLPPLIDEIAHQDSVSEYMNDVFTVPASLAGLPAISVPAGHWVDGPRNAVATGSGSAEEVDPDLASRVGIQVIGQIGDDKTVLQVAKMLEEHRTGTTSG